MHIKTAKTQDKSIVMRRELNEISGSKTKDEARHIALSIFSFH